MDYFYKKILSLLMGEMYHDPMVVFREYVQNACDSIDLAARKNVIDSRNKAVVDICLKADSVIIRDNGMGIPKDEVEKLLLGISSSEKDGIETIGKYGVGRLTGAKYCKKLTFETSYPGETCVSRVVWDIAKYKQLMGDSAVKYASEVIEKCTTCSYAETGEEGQHYFQVVLEGADKAILDVENVKNYLSLKVPADYTDTFKNVIIEPSCENYPEFKTRFENLKSYRITVNTINQSFKPFKVEVKNQNDSVKLSKQNYFVIKGYTGEELAWGWYSFPLSIKQINNCPFVGLQVRKHNMVVGYNDFLDQYLKKAKPYIAGELFITSNKIMPSSSRDGFYDSSEVAELFEGLKKYFKKVYNDEIDTLSRFRDTQIERTLELLKDRAICRKKVEMGCASQVELDEINKECDKKLDEYAAYLRSNKLNTQFIKEVSREIIDYYTQKINDSLPDGIEAINLYEEDNRRREAKKLELIGSSINDADKGRDNQDDGNQDGGNQDGGNQDDGNQDTKPEDKPVDEETNNRGKKQEGEEEQEGGAHIVDNNPLGGDDNSPYAEGLGSSPLSDDGGKSSGYSLGVKKTMEQVKLVIDNFEVLSPKYKTLLWESILKQVDEQCNEKSY